MNKITICTAVWKRPEVFKIWLECWTSLVPRPEIICAITLSDEVNRTIAEHYGCLTCFAPNTPVGEKWNHAHYYSSKQVKETDYYLTTASDDVMDQPMWDFYCNFKGERLCLSDLYFYDTESKKALYWAGYNSKHPRNGWPIGAHQLTRYDVMEKMHFKPFNDKAMAHEHDTHKKCADLGVKTVVLPMALTGGIAIDIKSKDSYSPFKEYSNAEFIPVSTLEKLSPEMMKKIIG